jgi:hypothetical protein
LGVKALDIARAEGDAEIRRSAQTMTGMGFSSAETSALHSFSCGCAAMRRNAFFAT